VTVEILQEAQAELDAAIAYYEDIEAGLGIRLKEEARTAIHWLRTNAEVPPLRAKGLSSSEPQSVSLLRRLFHLVRYNLDPCFCAWPQTARILATTEAAD